MLLPDSFSRTSSPAWRLTWLERSCVGVDNRYWDAGVVQRHSCVEVVDASGFHDDGFDFVLFEIGGEFLVGWIRLSRRGMGCGF